MRLLTTSLTVLLGLSAALTASPAFAQANDTSCTIGGTSYAESVLSPSLGEDESFLGARSKGLPTVAFVLDTSEHMRRFPVDLTDPNVRAQGLGCSNLLLNKLTYDANPCVEGKGQAASPFPATCSASTLLPDGYGMRYNKDATGNNPVIRLYTPFDSDLPFLFQNTRFYVHDRGWGLDARSVVSTFVFATAQDACNNAGSGADPLCAQCVQTSGYYLPLLDTLPPVVSGNWANFNPPKYVIARKILKDQFAALDYPSRNRLTMLTLATQDAARCFSANNGNGGMDSSLTGIRDGATLLGAPTTFKPPCNQFGNCLHSGAQGGGRAAFDNQVNGDTTIFTNPNGACPSDITSVPSGPDYPVGSRVTFIRDVDNVCRGTRLSPLGASLGRSICAPYAEALFNAGQYMGDLGLYDSFFTSGSPGKWRKSEFNNTDSLCPPLSCGCPRPAIVLLAGGKPDFDDNLPCEITGNGCSSVIGVGTCGGAAARGNLARVAKFLATSNMKPSAVYGNSPIGISTHIIGFGTVDPSLIAAAEAGNGTFVTAESAAGLRSAINEALASISSAQLSFSNSNISAVQTRTSSAILVPRFQPSKKTIWEGHLSVFRLVSEDACGCEPASVGGGTDPCDYNGDRQCGGVFFQDANNNWAAAGVDGVYLRAQPDPVTKEMVPITPRTPAVPLWDAAQRLTTKTAATGAVNSRRIYTTLDTNNDRVFDYRDQTVSFDETNVDALAPYLNLSTADYCPALSQRLGTCLTPRECARRVIQYVRGMDLFDVDCDGLTNDERAERLGDIFHSSPVMVDPPLSSTGVLCRLGLHNQCLVSLFKTSTVMDTTTYEDYATLHERRPKVVLVGANDGMFHAFHGGRWIAGDNPATPAINECPPAPGTCTGYYDYGTGDELWAYIPPDLLPKLQRLLSGHHQYFVDGTPMVRDIWADENSNFKKSADEFHTVAVVGERRGGNHYFALDVTNPTTPPTTGFLRWIWPQPNTPQARQAGMSYSEFLPTPPPIGPIRVKTSDARGEVHQGSNYEERWIVPLPGGFDPSGTRGSTVSLIDVWFGGGGRGSPTTPLWSFDTRTRTGGQPTYPIAATVALVGFGNQNTNPNKDPNGYFFDTATVADTGGRVWTMRFNDPDPAKWAGGLAFASNLTGSVCSRQPFYNIMTNAVSSSTGQLRTMVGSGDRFNMQDRAGGECSDQNLLGCVRRGCTLSMTVTIDTCGKVNTYTRNFTNANTANSCQATLDTFTPSVGAGVACCTRDIKTRASYTLNCVNSDSVAVQMKWEPEIECAPETGTLCSAGVGNQWACRVRKDVPFDICSTFDRCSDGSIQASTPPNAMYAFKVFDENVPGRFVFNDPTQAATYTTNALSAASLVAVDPYTPSPTEATASQPGWRLEYGPGHVFPATFTGSAKNERTATQATLIGGCAFWGTSTPSDQLNPCGTNQSIANAQYRLNYVTGGACTGLDAALATTRMTQNLDTLPPSPPQVTVFISPNGTITPSVTTVPRGQGGRANNSTVAQINEALGEDYVIEANRAAHECRHATNQAAAQAACPK